MLFDIYIYIRYLFEPTSCTVKQRLIRVEIYFVYAYQQYKYKYFYRGRFHLYEVILFYTQLQLQKNICCRRRCRCPPPSFNSYYTQKELHT